MKLRGFTALQSGGLGVVNPRKMLVFWFFCGEAAQKPKHKGGLGLRPKGK
jgi:hypothetical protein